VNIPLNTINTSESNVKKLKTSKFKIPSDAFQSRHRLFLFNDPEEMRRLLLSEEALTEIMAKTLKHAASSMFVTSFTTSAAFFTNMLTNISFVQVFGVFTGTCILIYFVITVTAIAAFAVS
jgi:predicted RND superfamily exporter protein